MSDREQYWAQDQSIRLCDATTGHSVRDVAFCDTPARAESFATAARAMPDLVMALEKARGYVAGYETVAGIRILKQIDAALAKVRQP